MKKGTTLTSCTVCVLNNKNTDGASTICGFSMEKMNPEKIKHVDMLQRHSEGYPSVQLHKNNDEITRCIKPTGYVSNKLFKYETLSKLGQQFSFTFTMT